ncbi:unnamed protein product [Hymenolepis diminuta]|uniref:Uncharacterized protein n=1 Tax=Hymenolepis diminuta TaxID=6216 RepID=A0A564YGZ9_HYMDI|nr:unnamed protein product [Hymenolepis diminuta]
MRHTTDTILNLVNAPNTSTNTLNNTLKQSDTLENQMYKPRSDPLSFEIQTFQSPKSKKFNLLRDEGVELILNTILNPKPDVDIRELCWTIGFVVENEFREFSRTRELPYKVEDSVHYANSNVEGFIKEMVAQSESGEMLREYYGNIALMLRTFYIIVTADCDEDSEFVLTMTAENHNLTGMPSVQEESVYQPSIQR